MLHCGSLRPVEFARRRALAMPPFWDSIYALPACRGAECWKGIAMPPAVSPGLVADGADARNALLQRIC